ncbi:beta strand repeat-containing protein [Anatilimnocola floriformis]|uniref:beta strand repeat-containing protein n=1 Tax=Anatilimnocola floriformis TaxID=2948575 RepID=UPI0020C57FA7|nr:Ig-like domain-containing protein [Anatilimnocola floriformis]
MTVRSLLAPLSRTSRKRRAAERIRQTRRRLFGGCERLEDRSLLATVSIPTNLTATDVDPGTEGIQIDIPVNFTVTEPAGVAISGLDVTFNFDPAKVTIPGSQSAPTNVTVGSQLAAAGFSGGYVIPSAGTLQVTASTGSQTSVLSQGTTITLFTIRGTIVDGATGTTRFNLRSGLSVVDSDFNDLTLVPAATNANTDAVDGLMTISAVVNNPPVNTAPVGMVPGTEDTPLAITSISVSDADASDTLTTTVSVPDNTYGTFTASAGSGTATVSILNGGTQVRIVGSQANVNAALQSLIFTPALNRANPPDSATTITVTTTDGIATDTDSFNVGLSEINDPPIVGADVLPNVNEDSAPIVIPVATLLLNDNAGAPNESTQTLTISSTFTNVVGGTVQLVGTDVIFTPTPNYNGPASFRYTITDNGKNGGFDSPQSGSGTASFNIVAVNDRPTFTPGPNQVVPFGTNTQQTVNGWATAITAGGGETQTLTFNVSNNSNGLFTSQPTISPTGVLTYTPTGVAGTATVTVVLMDNGGIANGGLDSTLPVTFTITVNSPGNAPTLNAIGNVTINEGAGLQTVNLSGITDGGDPTQQGISISVSSTNTAVVPTPTVNYTSPNNTGTLTFTPPTDANGTSTITVTVRDSGLDLIPGNADDLTTIRTFTVTVNPVNDAPSFVIGGNQTVNEDAGPQSVPGFATGISRGPADESTQTLNFTLSGNNNPGLFSSPPTIAADGTLTYTPAANANGTATISFTLSDNGGTANGGVDTSLPQSFTITVNPVNDPPTISVLGNQTVGFNAPAQTVNGFASVVSVGPNESGQTVTYNVTVNTNAGLFSSAPTIDAAGVLRYTPASGQQGTASITVVGVDNGGTANGGNATSAPVTFTITVNAPLVNSPPTISPISAVTINEDAGLQTVNFSGVSYGGDVPAQAIAISVSSSNPTLIPTPNVNYTSPNATGSLSFTPAANLSGTSTITVTVRDSGIDLIPGNADDGSVTTTFLVTVNAVNDLPSFVVGVNQTVNEDAGPQTVAGFATSISAGPADEIGQALTFNIATNSNPSLFAVAPAIAADGTLTYTPAANANGSATITVTLSDNGGGTNTTAPQTFTITVNPVNDAPSFTVGANQTVFDNAALQTISNWATAISAGPTNEAGQLVTFSVTANSNSGLFAVQPSVASNGTLTFRPAAGFTGTATITLVAQDNGGTANGGVNQSAPQSFTITVNPAPVNQPPTLNPITSISVNQNAGPQSVSLTGITAGGESQTIAISATSSNPALIPNPSISYVSPNTNGTLVYNAGAQIGTTTITVTVRDAGFDGILNNVDDGVTTQTFTIQVVDVNDPPVANDQTLSVQFNTPVNGVLTSSDPDGPAPAYALTSAPLLGTISNFNPATGAFTYTPLTGATGLDTFSFSVSDGQFSDTGVVRLAIQGLTSVVTPIDGDLLVIGTPNRDMIIITPVSAGVVQVRTDSGSGYYPVGNRLIVNAGDGNDYVVVTNVNSPMQIDAGSGDDYISTGMGDDVIIGGAGNDQINASGGNNIIWGDNVGEEDLPTGGNDTLSSLGGNDVMYGGGGNDQIFPGAGDDYVNAGQGDDLVSAGMGNDRVFGGLGNDSLYGDEGNDLLVGGGGSDTLVGRSGSDVLIGGLGADTLNGEDGSDILFGGNTTNAASSLAGDANDLALLAILNSWATSRPAGLLSGSSAGNDGSVDSLNGYTGDDDFYMSTGDTLGDFNMPFMGTDRLFSVL